ncbi:hypothetical protein J7L05_01925 [bacterium]|nr:hypothetical protein [bacterium]
MKSTIFLSLVILFTITIGFACSSNGSQPVTPTDTSADFALPVMQDSDTSRNFLGAWKLNFNPQSMEASITPNRDVATHYDATMMLPAPLVYIQNFDPITGILNVDVTITNPFEFSAYDLRLIIFSDNFGTRLTNPDDYTALYDIPGGSIINPFKAYAKGVQNREFAGLGYSNTQQLQLYFPAGIEMLDFAIDASYPGNCGEAYEIKNFTQEELYHLETCRADVTVEVYDWQDDADSVLLWCPSITGVTVVPFTQIHPKKWSMQLYNNTGASPGIYTACVIAMSENSGTTALYSMVDILIKKAPAMDGNTVIWGGSGYDSGFGVAVDESENIYTTGIFEGTVDFDPRPYVYERSSHGSNDIFLSKIDQEWNLIWVLTWGGNGVDEVFGMEIDSLGNIYVTGGFTGTVDFDPGDGVEERTSIGGEDIYLSKFNPAGDLVWALTWGGDGDYQLGNDVAIDINDNVYVAGQFQGTGDFDPGIDVDERSSNGSDDAFISKFNADGDFIWAQTWGAGQSDFCNGIDTDTSNNVIVTGAFRETVDFDPGDGEDNHIAPNGKYDIFVSKFNPDGDFIWARTWGASQNDIGMKLVADSSDNTYITGYYRGTVDFDPSLESDEHTSKGADDIFLSKFNSDGDFQWADTWGSDNYYGDYSFAIAKDDLENIYVTGRFRGTVDFDPGAGEDLHYTNGGSDLYLSAFNSDGDYLWAETWGGNGGERGYGVTVNGDEIFLTGYFQYTVDFDPASDLDVYTTNGYLDVFLMRYIP